jgi:hypothetical protein
MPNTFLDEIYNDVSKTTLMLERENNPDISVREKRAIDVFKRVLTVIDHGGLSVSDGHNVVSGCNNNLPVSSYMAHGSRVLIQIPPIDQGRNPHEFMNWLICGDQSKQFVSNEDPTNPLFPRAVSSHSTHLANVDNQQCFIEDKGVVVGALDALAAFNKSKDKAHHFGLNLAFGIDSAGRDSSGKIVHAPDGEHGHMYFHYRAPSRDYPGSLMIGVENSEPGKSNHSLFGTPNNTTHIGGSKWNKMHDKYQHGGNTPLVVVPKTLNGLRIDMDKVTMDNLMSSKVSFETRCLDTPPKARGRVTNHMLVNKDLGNTRSQNTVSLVELLVEHNSTEQVPLYGPPSASKNKSLERG